MATEGLLIVFESAPKGGKTTLASGFALKLRNELANREIIQGRSALTESVFSLAVKDRNIESLEYSTAFYWADLLFHNRDVIAPSIAAGSIVVLDRYDLSIISYREAHGLLHDDLLLDGYLQRGMLLEPDLTVFLNPPLEIMLSRIVSAADSTSIDRAFLTAPERLTLVQDRTRHHINRLNRKTLVLDTAALDIDQCLDRIQTAVSSML